MNRRIRTLKPKAWRDEKLGRVSRDARLLFVVLITLADDEGRFQAQPSAILGHGFPYDRDASRKLEKWAQELADEDLIHVYEVDGVQYGLLPKWSLHQRVSHPVPSVIPEPRVNGSGGPPEVLRKNSGGPHETLRRAS